MTKTKLTLCSLAALLAAGQAFAHTGVRDVALEGASSYNGFTITHGCGGDAGTDAYPVIGQAALFPFGDNAVFKDAAGNILGGPQQVPVLDPTTGQPIINPATGLPQTKLVNNGNGVIAADSLSLAPTGYASFSSPFVTSQEIVDELGNVQAFLWKDGAMEPKLNAVTPFKITAPTVVDNCTRLRIRVAVINYCDTVKNASNDASGPYKAPVDAFGRKIPYTTTLDDGGVQKNVANSPYFRDLRAGNGDNNRADWWFYNPEGGSVLYSDPDLMPAPNQWSAVINVVGSADQLATCPKDAKGNPVLKDVTVEPNGAAFDKYLTPKNVYPFSKGNSNL